MSDLPNPPENVYLYSYADDITTLSLHHDIQTAQNQLQPYLEKIHKWTVDNDLKLNADKSTSTLFTLHPNEFNYKLNIHINNVLIPTVQNPKILGLTFDPKLTFNQHIDNTKEKATKTVKLLKALTSTTWGKQKETIVTTYKTITRPVIEHASTIWSSTASKTNIKKLQTVQNIALRSQDCNRMHSRHQHPTSSQRNTGPPVTKPPTTTCISNQAKITKSIAPSTQTVLFCSVLLLRR